MRRPGPQLEWEKLRLIAARLFEQDQATRVIAARLEVDQQTGMNLLCDFHPDSYVRSGQAGAVESVWCLSKHHRMANDGIDDLDLLHAEARRHLEEIGSKPSLLHARFDHAGRALLQWRAQ